MTRYQARFVQTFNVKLPAESIDLFRWITEMTDDDYVSYSGAHKAMTSTFKGDVFFMKNIENIGADTLVQFYELKYHSPNHIQFYSSRSKAYMMRWFPVTVGVPWEMYVNAVSATCCTLVCMIGTDFPNAFLKTGAWFTGLGGLFLKRHLRSEGIAFVRDIEKKFKTMRPTVATRIPL